MGVSRGRRPVPGTVTLRPSVLVATGLIVEHVPDRTSDRAIILVMASPQSGASLSRSNDESSTSSANTTTEPLRNPDSTLRRFWSVRPKSPAPNTSTKHIAICTPTSASWPRRRRPARHAASPRLMAIDRSIPVVLQAGAMPNTTPVIKEIAIANIMTRPFGSRSITMGFNPVRNNHDTNSVPQA
jgi:hypothetical protein